MKSHLRNRARGRAHSMSTVPPPPASADYSPAMAKAATSILYRSPIPSKSGHAIYIVNAAALPDTQEVDYDSLLPYVLARLPGEDDLVSGTEYEVVVFAGSGAESATSGKKNRPGWGWFFQAYHILSRAMRKRIQKLYIVHERTWVRLLAEMFSTVVSPKFRRKIVHASTLSALALHIPIEDLLIPPSAYLQDRRLSPDIHVPYAVGRRAFAARQPLPRNFEGKSRLPRVLRETSSFLLLEKNVDTEGIFRIPVQAKVKEILREAYDRGQKFIVWKEAGVTLPQPPYPRANDVEELVAEVDQTEAYGVHMAGALIKFWYAELRDPMIPQSAYRELTKIFGNVDVEPSLEQLTDMISPLSEWSPLPAMSRKLLIRHLLPLLSEVAAHQETNKMTSENLAVCLAPTLVCGPDLLEDVKVSALVRRVLSKAIDVWPKLRETCGVAPDAFWNDLQSPEHIDDYEDPPDISSASQKQAGPADLVTQTSGIIMIDDDDKESQTTDTLSSHGIVPPPLPPRVPTLPALGQSEFEHAEPPKIQSLTLGQHDGVSRFQAPALPSRAPTSHPSDAISSTGEDAFKPMAPPLTVPPRYSTVVGSREDVTESPTTYTAPADGFGPPRRNDWSIYDSDSGSSTRAESGSSQIQSKSSVKRKPVGSGTSKSDSLKDANQTPN